MYKKAERALTSATNKLAGVRQTKIKLEGDVRIIEQKLEQIAGDIQDKVGKLAKIDAESKKVELGSKLEQVMGEFRQDMMSRIRPMLSQRASELLGEITHGRYSLLELDADYNMHIEDGGASFKTDRFSGGEGDLANLCLRIAISQELAERSGSGQSDFIALDEIFGSQDEGRKRSILEALQTLAGRFGQILIITHIEDVKETAIRVERAGRTRRYIKHLGRGGSCHYIAHHRRCKQYLKQGQLNLSS